MVAAAIGALKLQDFDWSLRVWLFNLSKEINFDSVSFFLFRLQLILASDSISGLNTTVLQVFRFRFNVYKLFFIKAFFYEACY